MTRSGHHSRNGFLTKLGLEEAAQKTSLEGLASWDDIEYVDSKGSVSGLRRDEGFHVWDDQIIERQYRRFQHGY